MRVTHAAPTQLGSNLHVLPLLHMELRQVNANRHPLQLHVAVSCGSLLQHILARRFVLIRRRSAISATVDAVRGASHALVSNRRTVSTKETPANGNYFEARIVCVGKEETKVRSHSHCKLGSGTYPKRLLHFLSATTHLYHLNPRNRTCPYLSSLSRRSRARCSEPP